VSFQNPPNGESTGHKSHLPPDTLTGPYYNPIYQRNYQMKVRASLLTTLILVACGGGGGGGGSPAVATGQFTDSPVKGLQYRTASQSGETNANGEFKYLPGETVTFFVGDITLGAALGAVKVTPFDLAGITPPASVPNSGQSTVAFDQAINLAVFLQTLDADGNPANGIEIPAQIRTMTSGLMLDFKQQRSKFSSTFALRKLVGSGRTAGLWGGVNAIRTPTLAIKAMYATLGVTPVLDLVTKVESIDPNSSKLLWRTTSTYDANGNQTKIVSETDMNGVLVTNTEISTFDANGNATHQESDSNGDGVIDGWNDTTFNVNGDPTIYVGRYDTNLDGMVDYVVTVRMTYNADGRTTGSRVEIDTNNDGAVDSISTETRSYDGNGNFVLSETDSNDDGVVDSRVAFYFDTNNHMTRAEEDANADGIVDIRSTYAYDSSGNRILTELDTNADGVVDRRFIYTFDTKGNQIRRDRDGRGNGVIDLRTVFTYDSNGYLILTEDDMGADGIIDQQTTYVHLKVAG
jgi:hypothetical protein